jgi:hypothetical protein
MSIVAISSRWSSFYTAPRKAAAGARVCSPSRTSAVAWKYSSTGQGRATLWRLRVALEKHGQPIVVNDLLIAAHPRSEALTRVTNNTSEFVRVPALEVEHWV